jgi:hypothetical protein
MILSFNPRFRIRVEIKKLQYFHIANSVFFFSFLFSFFYFKTFQFFTLLFFIFFEYFYLQTLRQLQYTFWTFSILRILFLIFFFFYCFQIAPLFWMLLFILSNSLLMLYFMSSPLYYPQVRWWEYDYRHKNDLIIYIPPLDLNISSISSLNTTSIDLQSSSSLPVKVPARMTDIRRHAACLLSFENFPDQYCSVIHFFDEQNQLLKIPFCVHSKRETSPGRPYKYGISFAQHDKDFQNTYKILAHLWHDQKYKDDAKISHSKLPST